MKPRHGIKHDSKVLFLWACQYGVARRASPRFILGWLMVRNVQCHVSSWLTSESAVVWGRVRVQQDRKIIRMKVFLLCRLVFSYCQIETVPCGHIKTWEYNYKYINISMLSHVLLINKQKCQIFSYIFFYIFCLKFCGGCKYNSIFQTTYLQERIHAYKIYFLQSKVINLSRQP